MGLGGQLHMTKHRDQSEEDKRLFRSAVGPVKRLHHDGTPQKGKLPTPTPVQTRLDEQRVVEDLLSTHHDPADLETGEELFYARPGLQYGVLRRLRRGQVCVASALDLHGMTAAVAKQAVAQFLRDAQRAGHRCVRIIHGKGRGSRLGQPVLKRKLDLWLRQRKDVLAFCSARPVDGGTGAVYVLLKRS